MAERLFLYPAADLKSLVVWDMERQQTLGQLGHGYEDDPVRFVAVRGSLAVSCQRSGPTKARVWSLETMQCTATLPAVPGDATNSVCCMDGRVLLGQSNGIVELWDVSANAPVALANLEGHTLELNDVKAPAAGSMVLSGSDDRTMRLWDIRTVNGCVRTMEGHAEAVWSVDMDGHCRTAVSGSGDKKVKLWDLGSGRCTETYEGHDDEVADVVMHESGSSFISSEFPCIVNAWAVGSTRAIMQADMASFCVLDADTSRLFASRDLSTVAFCSISPKQLGLSIWK